MSLPPGIKIKEEIDDIPDSFLDELGNQDFLQGLFDELVPENDAEAPSKVKTEPISDESLEPPEKAQQAAAKSRESRLTQWQAEDRLKEVERRIQERKKAGIQNVADQNPENEGDSPSSVDIEQKLEKRTKELHEIYSSNSRDSRPSRRRSDSWERSSRRENTRSVSREESPSRKRIRVKQEFHFDSPSPKREKSYRDASPGRSSDRRSPPTSRDRDRKKRSPGRHSKKNRRRDSRRSPSPKSRRSRSRSPSLRRRRSPLRSKDRHRTRDRRSRSRSPSIRSIHYRNRSRTRSRSPHGKRPSFLEEVKELLVAKGQQLPEDAHLTAVSKAEKEKILEEVRRDAPLPPAEAISKFLSGSSTPSTFAVNNSAGCSALPSSSKSTPAVSSHPSPKEIPVPLPVRVKIEPPDDTSAEFFQRRSQMESSTVQGTTTSATTNQAALPDVPNLNGSLLSKTLKWVESTTAAGLPVKREPDPDFIEVPRPKVIKIEPPDDRPSNVEGSEPRIKVETEGSVKVETETKLKVDTTLIDMAVRRDKVIKRCNQILRQFQETSTSKANCRFVFTPTTTVRPLEFSADSNRTPLNRINNIFFKYNSANTQFKVAQWGIVTVTPKVSNLVEKLGYDVIELKKKLKMRQTSSTEESRDSEGPSFMQNYTPYYLEMATQTENSSCNECTARSLKKFVNKSTQIQVEANSMQPQTTENDDLPLMRALSTLNSFQLLALNDFSEIIKAPAPTNASDIYRFRERLFDIYTSAQRKPDGVTQTPSQINSHTPIIHSIVATGGHFLGQTNAAAAGMITSTNMGQFPLQSTQMMVPSMVSMPAMTTEQQQMMLQQQQQQAMQRQLQMQQQQCLIANRLNLSINTSFDETRNNGADSRDFKMFNANNMSMQQQHPSRVATPSKKPNHRNSLENLSKFDPRRMANDPMRYQNRNQTPPPAPVLRNTPEPLRNTPQGGCRGGGGGSAGRAYGRGGARTSR